MRTALCALFVVLGALSAEAEEVMTLQWEGGVIAISPDDLSRTEADESGTLTVKLEPVLARRFADLTKLLIGETIAILVCGRELARPEVRARIQSGVIAIQVGARADAARAALNGETPCDGLWKP